MLFVFTWYKVIMVFYICTAMSLNIPKMRETDVYVEQASLNVTIQHRSPNGPMSLRIRIRRLALGGSGYKDIRN